ncbi:MAG: AAA family ATPase [Desulfosporosinus sp.]|nr:AAA family ATPase [Desulfosporosinus sp.]
MQQSKITEYLEAVSRQIRWKRAQAPVLEEIRNHIADQKQAFIWESLFSGLNNLSVYTLLNKSYSKYFGFLETEVEELLNYYGIDSQLEEVRSWYNGYIFGNTVVYNPWSVLQYTRNWKEGFS